MTAPCEACGEDPDLGKRCPVTELRHVPAIFTAAETALADAAVRGAVPPPFAPEYCTACHGASGYNAGPGERCAPCVTHGRRGPPSPERMAKGAGYYAEGAPADAPMLLVRRELFIAGILAERSRSAAELAAERAELQRAIDTANGETLRARAAEAEARDSDAAVDRITVAADRLLDRAQIAEQEVARLRAALDEVADILLPLK